MLSLTLSRVVALVGASARFVMSYHWRIAAIQEALKSGAFACGCFAHGTQGHAANSA